MMKPTTFFLFLFGWLCGVSAANAQRLVETMRVPDSARYMLRIYGEGFYHSGAVSNNFIDPFIRGGHIDSTLKTSVLNRLKKENRAGAELNAGMALFLPGTSFFGHENWGWWFGLSQHEYLNTRFSPELFQLGFFGNRDFGSETIDLGKPQVSSLSFRKLQTGIFHKKTGSYIGIGLVQGNRFFELQGHRATLQSGAQNEFIDLSFSHDFRRSDTTSSRLTDFNGWGIATDVVWNIELFRDRPKETQKTVRISLENLGFIRWNGRSLHQQQDTSLRYSGFEVNDFIGGSGTGFSDFSLNDTLGLKYRSGGHTRLLPFTLSIAKTINPFDTRNWQSFYGARFRLLSNYRPLLFAGVHYRVSAVFAAQAMLSYGGYGGLRGGLQVETQPWPFLKIALSSSDVGGWISGRLYGRDAALSVYALF